MPHRNKRQKLANEEHTFLAIRVESYAASVDAAVNYNVRAPELAWNSDEDDPLYTFTTQLNIVGVATYPKQCEGDTYEFTIYGDNLGSRDIRATLKDVQARDEGSPKYRTYRGRQVPIYTPPKGMGLINKVRGEPRWTAWLRVWPCFASDALVLLCSARTLFLAVHERKSERNRWIQNLSLQTTDPAEE